MKKDNNKNGAGGQKNPEHFNFVPILMVAAIAVAVAAALFTITHWPRKNAEEVPEVTVSEASLPDLSMVYMDTNPMIYDFINSSITYRWDGPLDESQLGDGTILEDWGFFYAIMFRESNPNTIFVENYSYGENLVEPALGTKPIAVDINNQQVDSMMNLIQDGNISESRVFQESINLGNEEYDGNWILLAVSEYDNGLKEPSGSYVNDSTSDGTWCGIPLQNLKNQMENGLMYETVYDDGMGFPTEWLMKEPFKSAVRKFAGLDMNDSFWQNFNYMQKVHCNSTIADANDIDATVVQLERFQVRMDGRDVELNMNEMYRFLEENDFEIPAGIYYDDYKDITEEDWNRGMNPEQ